MILVKHEFTVVTESRFHGHDDDGVELTSAQTASSQGKSSDAEEIRSLTSRPQGLNRQKHKNAHYADDYIQASVDPFVKEYGTETAINAKMAGRVKKRIV